VRRRELAFLVALLGSGFQLFGAMYGQGMRGDGMLFGAWGPDTATLGALIGIVAACASIAAAVSLMLRPDVRPAVAVLVVAGVVGTLAAGTLFGVGAGLAILGGLGALTLDESTFSR
jgi:hypothetical protein